jgi:hypothetical protein
MKNGNPNSGDDAAPFLADESLIDTMLALSPGARPRQHDRVVRAIELLREAMAAKAEHDGQDG